MVRTGRGGLDCLGLHVVCQLLAGMDDREMSAASEEAQAARAVLIQQLSCLKLPLPQGPTVAAPPCRVRAHAARWAVYHGHWFTWGTSGSTGKAGQGWSAREGMGQLPLTCTGFLPGLESATLGTPLSPFWSQAPGPWRPFSGYLVPGFCYSFLSSTRTEIWGGARCGVGTVALES